MTDLTDFTVKAINIALLLFCGIEAIIVLLNYPKKSLKSRASRIFFVEMLTIAFTMLCYAASLVIDSSLNSIASIILMAMASIGLYAIFFMYMVYVRVQINGIEGDRPVPVIISYIALVISIIAALLRVLTMFESNFKTFGHDMGSSVFSLQTLVGSSGGVVLVIMTMVLLIKYRDYLEKRQIAVLMSMPLLLMTATFIEPFLDGIELHYPLISIGFVIVYTQHHMDIETRYRIEEAENMRNRLTMATGRMKPHYLYNVLTSIYYLCDTDPRKAQYAIGTFSEYMRNTLEVIERAETVPFSWELTEIKNYVSLEELRFGDRIRVEYDIKYEDFFIPPLTIQPLVENAVKHGVSPKEEGGTVTISTRLMKGDWVQIVITDDGVGFNTDMLKAQEITREGIYNIRERIKLEAGGDLSISSSPGKGTVVTVTLKDDNGAS